MSAAETLERFDAQLALGATGALRAFNEAGVLAAADVHTALRLGRLAGEEDELVLLAAAFAVRAPRLDSVCVELDTIAATAEAGEDDPEAGLPWPAVGHWLERLARSPLVACGEEGGEARPLRLVESTLYLDRYWRDERLVAAELERRSAAAAAAIDEAPLRDELERLFPGEASSLQRLAAGVALLRPLAVVAGGPGTGKTTTVARILALLETRAAATGTRPPRVALTAPTGRAAARLAEAVHAEAANLGLDEPVRAALAALEAATLHRLLGFRPDRRTRYRHDRRNPLPHDVVVVDETSMVSLPMMARLLEAVRPGARMILVGDPEQLASVEVGAVLGDLVGPAADGLRMRALARQALEELCGGEVPATEPPPGVTIGDGIVVLRRSHRFGSGIAALAEAVRAGDAEAALERLRAGGEELRFVELDEGAAPGAPETLRGMAVAAGRRVVEAARAGEAREALDALGAFRLLCAHRRGRWGVAAWNAAVEGWVAAATGIGGERDWYAGRPLLVTANDYAHGLFNGDTGVVVAREDGSRRAAFERGGEIVALAPARLAAVETVYAMTIHKGQGSQFEDVAVLLPEAASRTLTRELLYTAFTRARRSLLVVGSEAGLRAGLERRAARASGLRRRLWGEGG